MSNGKSSCNVQVQSDRHLGPCAASNRLYAGTHKEESSKAQANDHMPMCTFRANAAI